MTDRDKAAELTIMVAGYGMALISMKIFAARLIAAGLSGSRLDDETLAAIKREAVLSLKNSETRGFSIESEVESIGNAVNLLNQVVDMAIEDGRKEHNAAPSVGSDDEGAGRVVDDDVALQVAAFPDDLRSALEAFASAHDPKMPRAEAIRYALRDWLTGMGYLTHPDDPEGAN